MQHLIHFSVKFWSVQKYRWYTEVFAVVQRFMRWQAVSMVIHCWWQIQIVLLPPLLLLFFPSFLQARPKVINSSSAHVWVQYEPTSLPTLTECLLKFASLGWSSCLCWNMNLKDAISGPYACLAVSNWSLGPQRSCLERTLSSDEETKVMVFWIKSMGFPLLLPSDEVLLGWTESSSLK